MKKKDSKKNNQNIENGCEKISTSSFIRKLSSIVEPWIDGWKTRKDIFSKVPKTRYLLISVLSVLKGLSDGYVLPNLYGKTLNIKV